MKLNRDEQQMLDGKDGRARQKAMELLVRYAEALGAESFVDASNVHIAVASSPIVERITGRDGAAMFSAYNLDSGEKLDIPPVRTYTTSHCISTDMENWGLLSLDKDRYEMNRVMEEFSSHIGINFTCTCTPYLCGNVPVKGQHCAWMESSAVPYCNAVLGGRTNTEGAASAGAIALTGKVPFWGLHVNENRRGTHLVDIAVDLPTEMEWDLMGYHVGELVQLGIPVFDGARQLLSLEKLKSLGAALASSGGVEMYHIVGITPEAPTLGAAFGGHKPQATITFGERELREAYRKVNSGTKTQVDLVVLGCPHYSISQIRNVALMIEGRSVNANTALWIWTARQIKALADRNGYTHTINRAGGHLLTDSCPLGSRCHPADTKVVATDSCKQAHYTPALTGLETWFGSTEDCVEAAVTGRWRGGLS